MLQYFDTLTDDSGNALLGATVTVTNYPSGSAASIYSSNGTSSPIATSTVSADITGQISFFVPDGAYTLTYAYKGTQYKVRSPVQMFDPMAFVAATDTGAVNAYVVTGSQYPAQKYVGLKLEFKAANTNTGPSTLNFQADGGFAINQAGGSPLVGGIIQGTGLVRVEWDGTQWEVIGAQSQPFYAQTSFEAAAGVTPTNFSYMPGNVKRYGAVGDGVTDDTTAISQALGIVQLNGAVSVYWPPGVYAVSTITMNYSGKYVFDQCTIRALSTSAQTAVVKFTAGYSEVYNLLIDCRWKSNYTCALWWTSATTASPAQSNSFYSLNVQNCLLGILFGNLGGGLTCPQSENYVYGMHSRGCQNVIQSNQPEGFIAFIGGELASSKNEWDINNPGVYNYNTANVVSNFTGVVRMVGCDLEKTDSTLGVGFLQNSSASSTEIFDCDMEIACTNLSLSAGYFYIRGIGGEFFGNGSTSWCVLSGSTGGVLKIGQMTLNKSPSNAGANTAFIDLGGASGWDIALDDLRLENQLNLIFANGSGLSELWTGANTLVMSNVYSPSANGGSPAPTFPRVNSSTYNLLDPLGTDNIGNDTTTWYHVDTSGAGSIATNADVPTTSNGSVFFNSYAFSNLTGVSDFSSMNQTSLATCKSTGIKVKAGDQFMVSAWIKLTAGSSAIFEMTLANTGGVGAATISIASTSNLVGAGWTYITGLITVPSGCAYMGIGAHVSSSTVHFIGAQVSKLSVTQQ